MKITDEAVEVVANELHDRAGNTAPLADTPKPLQDYYRGVARAVLEAVAPHIAAQALEEAAAEWEDLPESTGASIRSGTFDWFELFPLQHVRDRAAALRSGK